MIERNMRSMNASNSSCNGGSSTVVSSTNGTNKQPPRAERPCMASTVALPISTNSFRKLFASSGITSLMTPSTKENSFGSANNKYYHDNDSIVDEEEGYSVNHYYGGSSFDIMSLHHLCRKGHPKLEDIAWAINMNPLCLEQLNEHKQYPLHVAVANAIMPEAIMFMLIRFPKACTVPDIYGKLPLHYATASLGWTIKNGSSIFEVDANTVVIHPEYMNMVRLVCKTCPGALVHEDMEGRNPIEYALLDDSPEELVRNLQRTCVNYQRALKSLQLESQRHQRSSSTSSSRSSSSSSSSRITPPSSPVRCA